MLPLVHGRARIDRLLACDDVEEQRRVYREVWRSRRWRALVGLGRGELAPLLADFERLVTTVPARDNYLLQWVLTGGFRDSEAAWPWLSTAGHAALRAALPRIRIAPALDAERFTVLYLAEDVDPAQARRWALPGARIATRQGGGVLRERDRAWQPTVGEIRQEPRIDGPT